MWKPARLKLLAWMTAVLGVIAFLAGSLYGSQAQLVQLVRPDTAATADLFGAVEGSPGGLPGTPIGSPQHLIIRSADAFLPGQGEGGVRYVSQTKLRDLGEYPLQQKTVFFFRNASALGFLALSAVLGLLASWRQSRRPFPTPSPLPPEVHRER